LIRLDGDRRLLVLVRSTVIAGNREYIWVTQARIFNPEPAMHANSSGVSVFSAPLLPLSNPPASSFLHLHYPLIKLPLMRSKAGYPMPDQPDRRGMRYRRKKDEMTLSELQLSRRIELPENPHAALLEAYGYRELAQRVMDLPTMGRHIWHSLSNVMSFRIGPSGIDAMPARARIQMTSFVNKHSHDFEIWLSSSAQKADDMQGMLFVIGEDHYDASIQEEIRGLLLDFQDDPDVRLFLEGGEHEICEFRPQELGMAGQVCVLLEDDMPSFQEVRKLGYIFLSALQAMADFLRTHVASARADTSRTRTVDQLNAFIQQHYSSLPAALDKQYSVLFSELTQARQSFLCAIDVYNPEKEQWMSAKLRRASSINALNVAVVGAVHLLSMRTHLQDRKCIFMVPRSIISRSPEMSLLNDRKDDL